MAITSDHAKYFSHDLTRRSVNGIDPLSMSLFDAAVDLNPHQIEAQEKKIETQKNEIAERKESEQRLQSQIDDLKKIVCSLRPDADGCKQGEK